MKRISMVLCVLIGMFFLVACTMGEDKSAVGSLQESDINFGADEAGGMVSNESGQQNEQMDDIQQNTTEESGESDASEPEEVFLGSWQVEDYRTSRIYALSQEEIDAFLTYGVAYYEDSFSLNGTPVEAEDFGYVYEYYTREEVEELFNIDMRDWWNENTVIAYVGITSAESDLSPSLGYCFGTQFFAVDADTIWIYYEGVFFQAKRAGA